MSIAKLKTKFFTGAFLVDVKHYFTKINEIIDYLNGVGKSGDGSYKEYTVLLSQSSTNAPTVKILQNTLGYDVIWTYYAQGEYKATFPVSQNVDKQFLLFGNGYENAFGYYDVIRTPTIDTELLLSFITPAAGLPENNLLNNTSFEYRIYN